MTVSENIVDELQTFYAANEATIIRLTVGTIGIITLWIIWSFLLGRIKSKLSPTQHNAMRTLGRALIVLLGLFWFGGEGLFIGAAALLGTAIGFASSSTIGNFISGLYLLVTNPFNVGDYVILPNLKVEGIVEEISINYTSILSPEGIQVLIANQKLLGTIIKNTEITIPSGAIDKGTITWRDHEGDKFDSVDDVVDILKGVRTKFTSKEDRKFYLYPLEVKLSADKFFHSRIKLAILETIKEFSERTVTEITWILKDRSTYQLNLIVENPYVIFDLKSDILGFLEEKIEELHK
ncbi:MAG: mechanosensitive ion channel domain-containing protein [Candidatus Hodarchaeales archaeon]|jgi:hypothetical protein